MQFIYDVFIILFKSVIFGRDVIIFMAFKSSFKFAMIHGNGRGWCGWSGNILIKLNISLFVTHLVSWFGSY